MSKHHHKGDSRILGTVTQHDWPIIDKLPEYKGIHHFFQKLKKKPKTFLDLLQLWDDYKKQKDQ